MDGLFDYKNLQGVIPRAFQYDFDYMLNVTNEKHLVRTSYFEIHNEEIRDLPNPSDN